jgi:quinol monooxygenase YgiN
MPIKVVVEFQAKPGERAKLKSLLAGISATHGSDVPGFLGSTVYEVLDTPDGLVEIADWESAEAQAAAVKQATAAGVYAPVVELVAAPFKATRIGQLS